MIGLLIPRIAVKALGYCVPSAAAPVGEEPVEPRLIVWVCLRCDRAFSEQDKALEHHTKRKHRLSKRRVE